MILLGNRVRGGIYGTMFPEEELDRLHLPSADTLGVNGLEHVFGAVCDGVQPGTKPLVFPGHAQAPTEPGFSLKSLFRA